MKTKYKLIGVGVVLLLCFLAFVNSIQFNKQTRTCQVTSKESVRLETKNQYRIYTTCGTYVIEDSISIFRFDSADIYGTIAQGTTYEIYAGGIRAPFLSRFPNIISVNKTQQQ